MTELSRLPIVGGPVPWLIDAFGLAALVWLAWGSRRYVTRWLPAAAVASLLLAGLVWFFSERVWNLWGAPQPKRVYLFAALGFLAVLLMVPKMIQSRRLAAKIVAFPAAALLIVTSASLLNLTFEYYPTFGSLFGDTGVKVETLQQFRASHGGGADMQPAATTLASWQPPSDMPAEGQMLQVAIPAPTSHEVSSSAYVYLPPAYLGSRRANLPVLVLIHGVPGGTLDWPRGGMIAQFMNHYAQAHNGLTPIVVMPDAGGRWAKYPPLCLNSGQGQAATYLAHDIPDWVKKTFGAGTLSARQWAIGGFSYGGTCAMQLAVNYPGVYPTFIDSSGENEPLISQGHDVLLRQYFGGSQARFEQQNALNVLKTRRFPHSAGIVTVGRADSFYRPQGIQVFDAMKRAGMDVAIQDAPGGHAWPAWKYGMENNMDWLLSRLGVLPSPTQPPAPPGNAVDTASP
ncbi:hypothetical protein IV498_12475 [Paenarthrobacter sp. Z7-10]|uniref:alpha/beta hydrolase-fold protein n=1 Tax=Paenarthrobacter sp. Z7-10 TaxID=2787635 RepID=UPI0022A93CAD|nr:alpha/beta hydrolase-fold protein [Paenarthrobacter sp. Z7-10]MCZ2403972.1 hypothetical protein [Paenarthrobacter sp. Z7-10]